MTNPKLIEMDPDVRERDQLAEDGGAFVFINHFVVKPDQAEAFVEIWTKDASFCKVQPGFVSTQLHRGIAGGGSFLNYAVWESVAQYREAFEKSAQVRAHWKYPEGMTTSPHLFRETAVPGIRVA